MDTTAPYTCPKCGLDSFNVTEVGESVSYHCQNCGTAWSVRPMWVRDETRLLRTWTAKTIHPPNTEA